MRRTCFKVQKDEKTCIYRTRLEGPACEAGQIRNEQILMLRVIADEPSLLACSVYPFQQLKMKFVDDRWVVETEAEIVYDQK